MFIHIYAFLITALQGQNSKMTEFRRKNVDSGNEMERTSSDLREEIPLHASNAYALWDTPHAIEQRKTKNVMA